MLYQLGFLTFEVAPVNLHEVERAAGADYAAKVAALKEIDGHV